MIRRRRFLYNICGIFPTALRFSRIMYFNTATAKEDLDWGRRGR